MQACFGLDVLFLKVVVGSFLAVGRGCENMERILLRLVVIGEFMNGGHFWEG